EAALLGALITQSPVGAGATIARVAELLQPGDFYTEAHRTLFEVVLRVALSGRVPDAVTISAELRQDDQLEAVGGPAGLAILAEAGALAVNLDQYVEIIRERSVQRRTIQHAADLMHAAYNGEPTADLEGKAAAVLRAMRARGLQGLPEP